MNSNEETDDETSITKAHDVISEYIHKNFQDINTVSFNNFSESSMGGLIINGTVNEEAEFSVSFDINTFSIGSFGRKKGFPDRKDECKERDCE